MKVKEPFSGGCSQGISVKTLQGRWRMFCRISEGVLLAFITGENTRKVLKKYFHVGCLVSVHDGTAGCAEALGKNMEIGPEGRTPLGRFLNKKRRGDFFCP
jgi:hypothetical protein